MEKKGECGGFPLEKQTLFAYFSSKLIIYDACPSPNFLVFLLQILMEQQRIRGP